MMLCTALGDGAGTDESCPHSSQNRPVIGAWHAGHAGTPAGGDEVGCGAGIPIGEPHTSQ
jgi:hypothetical protein